jgi:putative ABC transport system permease protein
MDSLLYTQGAFGLLALLVASFLVVNLIAAMLAGQVREIGVMKTLGAQSEDLAHMYLGLAFALGCVASLLALPAAVIAGRAYGAIKAELLNFDVQGYAVPGWAIALQLLVGAFLPVVAAALPVRRGTRLSVAKALRDVGIAGDLSSAGVSAFANLRLLPRPTLLSLRNAFRKRQRMILTLLALASGGSVYLAARNLRASVIGSLDLLFDGQKYDFTIRLSEPQDPRRIEGVVNAVSGVVGAESWGSARAAVARADGTLGNAFPISSPPVASRLIAPRLVAGRWLVASDTNALVVNRTLLRTEAGLRLGERTSLAINGDLVSWRIVGVVDAGPAPTAFTWREVLARATRNPLTASVVVATDLEGPAAQVDLIQRVRRELDAQGWRTANSQLLAENRRVTEDHLVMVVDFLAAMGWVMVVVGGMGLASTMGLAVLERTREIGVMRAIGARHGSILAMVQVEGLVVALLAWLVALPASLPMSAVLGEAFGRVMLEVPITWVPDATGVLLWLALVVVVSILACAWPAYRAMRVAVARALAYE